MSACLMSLEPILNEVQGGWAALDDVGCCMGQEAKSARCMGGGTVWDGLGSAGLGAGGCSCAARSGCNAG